jgi:hypothetical protein
LQENRDSRGNLPQVTQLRWDKMTTADALSCVTSIDFSQSVASLCWIEGTLAVPSDVVRCKVSLVFVADGRSHTIMPNIFAYHADLFRRFLGIVSKVGVWWSDVWRVWRTG